MRGSADRTRTTETRIAHSTKADQNAVSAVWAAFSEKLAAALQVLKEDDCLIISEKHTNHFVQVVCQGTFGYRLETISDYFRSASDQLTEDQIAELVVIGWSKPTGNADDSDPSSDPLGSPNFFRDAALPVNFDELAVFAVETLRKGLGVSHPGHLQYQATDACGNSIAMPLGLKLAIDDEPLGKDALNALLIETIRQVTNVFDWQINPDETIGGIRYGDAVTFVRLMELNERPYARIFSVLFADVEETHGLLKALNNINAEDGRLHLFVEDGDVLAVTDVLAAPFSAAVFSSVLGYFCQAADELCERLQLELGIGESPSEPKSSPIRH